MILKEPGVLHPVCDIDVIMIMEVRKNYQRLAQSLIRLDNTQVLLPGRSSDDESVDTLLYSVFMKRRGTL